MWTLLPFSRGNVTLNVCPSISPLFNEASSHTPSAEHRSLPETKCPCWVPQRRLRSPRASCWRAGCTQSNLDPAPEVLLSLFSFFRTTLHSHSRSDLIVSETTPGLAAVPAGDGPEADAAWREYIMENFAPTYHPLGTAAMLSRELNGALVY